jgi:hypothetical protein
LAKKELLVELVEKAIVEKAAKASPKEVVEGMFKGALAAALAQQLQAGGRVPAAYIERCKSMLITTFQNVEGDFDKSDGYFALLFNEAMKEILMFCDQQHSKETKVTERKVDKILTAKENFTMTKSGLIIPKDS